MNYTNTHTFCWTWWLMLVITAVRKRRLRHLKFKDSQLHSKLQENLGYFKFCLKKLLTYSFTCVYLMDVSEYEDCMIHSLEEYE